MKLAHQTSVSTLVKQLENKEISLCIYNSIFQVQDKDQCVHVVRYCIIIIYSREIQCRGDGGEGGALDSGPLTEGIPFRFSTWPTHSGVSNHTRVNYYW